MVYFAIGDYAARGPGGKAKEKRWQNRNEAGLVAGLTEFLRILRFIRCAHHDVVVVEPTGGGLFCHAAGPDAMLHYRLCIRLSNP